MYVAAATITSLGIGSTPRATASPATPRMFPQRRRGAARLCSAA